MLEAVFRADASSEIGHGHVMRCLTLAEALREDGMLVSFVCREYVGDLCDLIEARGIPVTRLSVADETAEADANATLAALDSCGSKPDWAIVDHYRLGGSWEGKLRSRAKRIMVIDDLADRKHDCDVLLDQNIVDGMHERHVGKTPGACDLLLGPKYALLQQAYAKLHGAVSARKGEIRRIFVFFGGADTGNLTVSTIRALLSLGRPGIEVDVVISPHASNAEEINQLLVSRSNVHLHSGLASLAPLMAAADLAIGGSGATTWERLCLGLPSLVVSLAENQRAAAAELNRVGLVRWLGHCDEVDEAAIAKGLSDLIASGLEEEWSRRCLSAVDGKGTNRVREVLKTRADGN